VSAETAGPATTNPELRPAGDHPSVGGRGVFGSADSPLVGVSTLGYPSEHADPLDSACGGLASAAEVMTAAGTTHTVKLTSRQPPTVAEVTAAASRSPTLFVITRKHDVIHKNQKFMTYCNAATGVPSNGNEH